MKIRQAVGVFLLVCTAPLISAQTVAPFYSGSYSVVDLGTVAGVPSSYGGLIFKAGDPDTILLGGSANGSSGLFYSVPVTRGAGNHIVSLGTGTPLGFGINNDGGIAYGPGGVLFYSQYPVNNVGQVKPGDNSDDKTVALSPLGISSSTGGLNFVPVGYNGAGQFKISIYSTGEFYSVTLAPDGSGTYDLTAASLEVTFPPGPEGFAYVPQGSALFPSQSMMLAEYNNGSVASYTIDANGNPVLASRQDFITGLTGAEGAAIDPVTGDLLVSTYGGGDHIIAVRGFVAPKVTTALATSASPAVALGTAVSDTAALSGGVNPTGTISFNLYGPNDATCSGAVIFTSTVTVSGNANYASGPFIPSTVGTYRWIANYGGDANNTSTTNACNAANENVVVSQATPALLTLASAAVPLGATISDTATLSGGVNPTGTIVFRLFGPNDATCSGATVFMTTITAAGNGSYASGNFAPVVTGTYRWVANYSGDANNAASTNGCNSANESVIVGQSVPTLITTASAGVALGGTISDTAVLTGGVNPTGTILFRLYGPNDATCTGAAIFSSTVVINGDGSYVSTPTFAASAAGTYRWIANYSGDINNAVTGNVCNGANENVVVGPAAPNVVAVASPSILLGSSINNTASLSGASNPTGTITFSLYGPDDTTCSGAVIFSSTATVNGNGNYISASFTPSAMGTYRWIANYSGDANNTSTTNACNAPNGNVSVTVVVVTTPIPTVGDAALVCLAMLLGVMGLVAVRRHSTKRNRRLS